MSGELPCTERVRDQLRDMQAGARNAKFSSSNDNAFMQPRPLEALHVADGGDIPASLRVRRACPALAGWPGPGSPGSKPWQVRLGRHLLIGQFPTSRQNIPARVEETSPGHQVMIRTCIPPRSARPLLSSSPRKRKRKRKINSYDIFVRLSSQALGIR